MKCHALIGLLLAGCAGHSGSDAAAIRDALTPVRVAAINVPLLFSVSTRANLGATLVPVAQNGPVRTWRTADAVQISTAEGIVVATRGLGDDLMSADASALLRALPAGGGQYLRHTSRLDGNFGTIFEAWSCQLRTLGPDVVQTPLAQVSVIRFEETCTGGDAIFVNLYGRAPDGTIWTSRQWIGPDLGYLDLALIRP
ncbi:YjbF family lipoprotein [Yoonia sediminilitoris]|uniref:Group 4 capsule polysaccharide lipoprotein GfcB/YjbF n=1 Tax=Yoonia sediminilitoris TaxID=1286148 RepID=A0A2T6KB70_9RHOB|nr:YjbF family lipoprotein [Yoonia sediminilitoris]PUB12124.1 group 4 capsule polysaccharide lipoprotein GfcB/YjbF [Yoonia sediminilitoris]RCW92951.1 group 4 capsule polysaccharide lipoprotein GfcB/YjbF [Yoonia sediminilitoris]